MLCEISVEIGFEIAKLTAQPLNPLLVFGPPFVSFPLRQLNPTQINSTQRTLSAKRFSSAASSSNNNNNKNNKQ